MKWSNNFKYYLFPTVWWCNHEIAYFSKLRYSRGEIWFLGPMKGCAMGIGVIIYDVRDKEDKNRCRRNRPNAAFDR